MMIRMVGGWMFLLVPAHPGSPGWTAVEQLLLYVACIVVAGSVWDHQLGNVVSEEHESSRRSLHVEPRQEFRPRQGVDHLSRWLQPTVFKCACRARCQFKVSHFADPLECTDCHQLLSVKHLLTECISCDQAQQQNYVHTNLKDIFNYSTIKYILNFKNVNLRDTL